LLERLRKIEVINIEQCTSAPYFLFGSHNAYTERDGGGYGELFIRLKELKLTKVYDIKRIWLSDKPTIIDLRNLQILHIKCCNSLQYVFSLYSPEKLHQLKELVIEACEDLSTIFERHVDKVSQVTKFPLLSKVEFKSLPKLTQIYDGHLEFPSLQSLMVEKCPILTEFTTDGKSFFELNEIVFDSFDHLVCVISSETLQELRNLKKLYVSHCKELKKIFNIHEEISSSTQLLQQLYELALIDLPELTHIVNKEISRFYQNLQILHVKQCNSLNLLQVPLKLTNLEISDCEALEKIIIIEEEEGRREKLNFRELKDVSLENLSKLSVAFPSIFEFSSLQTIKISNCSAMRSFAEDSKALTESSTTNYFFPSSVSFNYKLFITLFCKEITCFPFLVIWYR